MYNILISLAIEAHGASEVAKAGKQFTSFKIF